MKDLVRRLTKDGSVSFTERTRDINRKQAEELVIAAEKAGYKAIRRTTAFGYIVYVL